MITIEMNGSQATFDANKKDWKWHSEDKALEKKLNASLPNPHHDHSVSSVFRFGRDNLSGYDSLYYDWLVSRFESVVIVKYQRDPIPEEKDGIIY